LEVKTLSGIKPQLLICGFACCGVAFLVEKANIFIEVPSFFSQAEVLVRQHLFNQTFTPEGKHGSKRKGRKSLTKSLTLT